MPAAAVIPAPVAYIKVVAVKKLVVGFLPDRPGPLPFREVSAEMSLVSLSRARPILHWIGPCAIDNIYFEKIRVFKAGLCF